MRHYTVSEFETGWYFPEILHPVEVIEDEPDEIDNLEYEDFVDMVEKGLARAAISQIEPNPRYK